MWLDRFTNYLLEHPWQAIALTFVLTFVPVVGTFGILIAALFTLRKNVVAGALLTVAATVPYLISFSLAMHKGGALPLFWVAFGIAVTSNILTWIFAAMLSRQTSWSVILQIAALVGVLVISIVHLTYPEVANWWGGQLQSSYLEAQNLAGSKTPVSPKQMQLQMEAVNFTKSYATGFIVASVLLIALMQLALARWWQSLVFSPGSLRRELHTIRLSQLATGLFVVNIVLFYLGNSVALDIMPVLCLLFLVAGLSLIHYLFGLMHSPTRWFWLCMVYAMLIFAMPVSMVVILLLAVVDAWVDVRKRFNKI